MICENKKNIVVYDRSHFATSDTFAIKAEVFLKIRSENGTINVSINGGVNHTLISTNNSNELNFDLTGLGSLDVKIRMQGTGTFTITTIE